MTDMVLTVVLSLCLVASITAMGEVTAENDDKDDIIRAMDGETFSAPNENIERIKKTSKGSALKSLFLDKRTLSYNTDQAIRQACFSGDLYQTVKALGVFNIPGVTMVQVTGNLFENLKVNKTMKMSKSAFETTFKGNYDSVDGSGGSQYKRREITKKSVAEISKRGTDICEESAGVLVQLAHANGQLAYVVYDYDCAGSTCSALSVPIGNCQQKIQTIVLYLIDEYGSFVPSTEEIGCGCECILY